MKKIINKPGAPTSSGFAIYKEEIVNKFIIDKGEELLKDLEAIKNNELRSALTLQEQQDTFDWLIRRKDKLTFEQQKRLKDITTKGGLWN